MSIKLRINRQTMLSIQRESGKTFLFDNEKDESAKLVLKQYNMAASGDFYVPDQVGDNPSEPKNEEVVKFWDVDECFGVYLEFLNDCEVIIKDKNDADAVFDVKRSNPDDPTNRAVWQMDGSFKEIKIRAPENKGAVEGIYVAWGKRES